MSEPPRRDAAFYRAHRVQLHRDRHYLSAGLQPRVLFSRLPGRARPDLITFTNAKLMSGGGFRWRACAHVSSPTTGARVPVYGDPEKLAIDSLYPVAFDPTLVVAFTNNFFTVYRRVEDTEFVMDEAESERFGVGLLDAGLPRISTVKIEVRDLNGSGLPDVIVGENDWSEYHPRITVNGRVVVTRWSHPEYRPFDHRGWWRGGRPHGRAYFVENRGPDPADPGAYQFAPPVPLENVDQYGFCTPVFADFTGNGLEDLVAGDFLRNLTFHARLDDRDGMPRFAPGKPLLADDGRPRQTRGVINYLVGHDLTGSGKPDLVMGSENGLVTLLENLDELARDGTPRFAPDLILQQERPPAKADILAVPAAGVLRGFPGEQRGPGESKVPETAAAVDLVVGGGDGLFYHFAGAGQRTRRVGTLPDLPRVLPPDPQGSIQGPTETGWGYVAPTLFDWNANGRLDVVFSDINGHHQVALNAGTGSLTGNGNRNRTGTTRGATRSGSAPGIEPGAGPRFAAPFKIRDAATGIGLTTVWRVKPALLRLDSGAVHYYCLDETGALARYHQVNLNTLAKDRQVCTPAGQPVMFTSRSGGSLGRDKFTFEDWTGNGQPDLLVGLPAGHDLRPLHAGTTQAFEHAPVATVAVLENAGTRAEPLFQPPRYLRFTATGRVPDFGHHSCAPTTCRVAGDLYLIVGAEDGQLYRFRRADFT